MKTIRHLILVLFFTGLISLEVWHGVFRLDAIGERQRGEALESIRRGQVELGRGFAETLRAERDHARYLVKMPAARRLLATTPGSPESRLERAALERDLSPYLISFPVIDRLALYDAAGAERLRMTRLAAGIGSIPEELLGRADLRGPSSPDSTGRAPAGDGEEVFLSGLEIDPRRIEVPENDRQVLRYTALFKEKGRAGDEARGALVLTLYAAPLLEMVRRWEPLPGVRCALVDARGSFLAHPDRAREQARSPGLSADHTRGAAEILAGGAEARDRDVLLLGLPIAGGIPGWRLVARVPDSALEASLVSIRGEYGWVIGSMAATALLIILAGGFLLRLSIREVRLAESERYLERIRRESARYRALMDGAADMILIVSPRSEVIREANAIARRVLGLAQGEHRLEEVLPPELLPFFRERLSAAASGEAADLGEIRLRGPQGREIPASGRLAAIDLEEERVVEVALRDLTREKEMERQVRISERLGSLGLLTAGVAHEINNPLEGIENYLTLLDREGGDPQRRTRYLEMVRYGFRRIRDIVRDLSSFSRPAVEGSTADLTSVVERALGMVGYHRAFRTVEVERSGLDRPLFVLGDAGRLEQVFINLLVNAGRAMEGSGRVFIAAQEEPSGGWVEVRVEDTGPGIPEEALGRIFDPFFTTGEGTGLGLSVSYGIVRAHGGELRAENRPGGGARFVLRLPAAGSGAEMASAVRPTGAGRSRR